MEKRVISLLRYAPFIATLYGTNVQAVTNDMGGTWSSLTLSGAFDALSPKLKDFKWLILEQARTRDDNPDGMRFSENLLFAQVGYQMNPNISIWLGYTHDWLHPLNKPAYQESRAYQDFVWTSKFDDLTFISRTRLEQRVNENTGNVGVRARQFFQLSHSLRFIDENLSVYAGEEMFVYLNNNSFGRTGFTENRAFGGVSYQFNQHLGADLGYMGQYIYNKTGNNVFTHNVQFNLRYQF